MAYCEKSAIFANEMELERHIEILLLDNDCVIVPGLGGFIAYHTDARYDADSASFLPPSRIAGFNPKLSMNDNLLAQSYVETYDISYPEAVKRISSEAEELKSKLERYGYYEISGVGTLKVNNNGGYDFEPFEAGLLTPDYYGLGCFEALSLACESITDEIASTEENTEEIADSGKFIKIKVSTIRNFAAAAVAIFAFFLLSSPLGNSEKNIASIASLQNSVFYKMMPQHEPSVKTSDVSEIKVTENKKTEVKSEVENKNTSKDSSIVLKTSEKAVAVPVKKEIKKAEVVKAEDYYCIVLASALSKHNAENFVKKLTSEGGKNIQAIDCSNGMKVVCGRYASEKEARMSLDTMRTNENFKDAWIYKVKVKK